MTVESNQQLLETFRKIRADRVALEADFKSYCDGAHASQSRLEPHIQQILVDAVAAGYMLWHENSGKACNPFLLQKRFTNTQGHILYFIDLHVWDLARQFGEHPAHCVEIQPQCRFQTGTTRRGPDERSVAVTAFTTDIDTLADIEAFFAKFYATMGCLPYDTDP